MDIYTLEYKRSSDAIDNDIPFRQVRHVAADSPEQALRLAHGSPLYHGAPVGYDFDSMRHIGPVTVDDEAR